MRLHMTAVSAALTLAALGFATSPASAAPIADFRYVESALGGGTYQYEFTLFNLGDPVADDGFEIYDVFVSHASATFTVVGAPSGWGSIAGFQFANFFSSDPGPPPIGADVPPGMALGGFTLTTDMRVGDIPFEVYFTNPDDPFEPLVFEGVTSPLAVPEPASLWLLAMGAGLAGWRRLVVTSRCSSRRGSRRSTGSWPSSRGATPSLRRARAG